MSLTLTHPPVHMPESTKFTPERLLRVDGGYVVAYGKYRDEDTYSNRIGTRWVTLETGKVFPQSRGYATWDLIPEDDEISYLVYMLPLSKVDKDAVLDLLHKRSSEI